MNTTSKNKSGATQNKAKSYSDRLQKLYKQLLSEQTQAKEIESSSRARPLADMSELLKHCQRYASPKREREFVKRCIALAKLTRQQLIAA